MSVNEEGPGAQPTGTPPARPGDPDWDDYWAHKVAEKAKGKILSFFGLATVVLTLLGIKGLDEVKDGVTKKFDAQVALKEKEASERVSQLMLDFQRQIDGHTAEVAKRKEEFMRITVVSPENRSSTTVSVFAPVIDLSDKMGPIRDQQKEGSTVGFSVAYALEAEIRQSLGRTESVSARGIYVVAKRHDEWPGENYEGTSVRGALKGLTDVGAHLEGQWPYAAQTQPPGTKPQFRITGFSEVPNDSQRLIMELRKGKVVVLSITATEDFFAAGPDGRVIVKGLSGSIGGHSIAIVGYDPTRSEFRFANMWGTTWGDKGFGVIRDSDLKKIFVGGYVIEKLAE